MASGSGTNPEQNYFNPENLGPRKVYYLGILRISNNEADELVVEKDVSSFGWLTQNNYATALTFTAKTISKNRTPGSRDCVIRGNGKFYTYATGRGYCCAMGTETDYNDTAAQMFLSETAREFESKFPLTDIRTKEPGTFTWPALKDLRKQAETAHKNAIFMIDADLRETKQTIHKTIESVLERGEKLDSLVAKSEDLSAMSKGFYKTAKQQNSCCLVM